MIFRKARRVRRSFQPGFDNLSMRVMPSTGTGVEPPEAPAYEYTPPPMPETDLIQYPTIGDRNTEIKPIDPMEPAYPVAI
jgi:hypothetical protein